MASKNRAKSSRQAAARSPRRQPQAPIGLLHAATYIVGEFFGTTSNCADAAALLVEIGHNLGFKLAARPVSVQGFDATTGHRFVMGPKATSALSPKDRQAIESHLPDGKDNGHIVLTLEKPSMLFDPNIRQLGQYGIDAPSIIMNIESTNPASGQWDAKHEGLSLIYLVDEENEALLPRFNSARLESKQLGRSIARDLQAGRTADQVCHRLQVEYDYRSLSSSR